jgi:hypothetical protein
MKAMNDQDYTTSFSLDQSAAEVLMSGNLRIESMAMRVYPPIAGLAAARIISEVD